MPISKDGNILNQISLRDYFAAQYLSNKNICDEDIEIHVKQAYRVADAMLLERGKDKNGTT